VRAAVRGLVVGPSGLADLALRLWAAGLAALVGVLAYLSARPCAPLSAVRVPAGYPLPDRPSQALHGAHSVAPTRGPCPVRRPAFAARTPRGWNRVIVL
jgi:hypothetical protein